MTILKEFAAYKKDDEYLAYLDESQEKLGKIVDRLCNGFQFVGGVLPLPILRILPALFSLNA